MRSIEDSRRNPRVRLEKFFAHSPQRVWNALTDPGALSQWMLPTTFKPLPGRRFRFTRLSPDGKRQSVHCKVVEVEAPYRLAYTWQAENEDAPTLVTFTLEAVAEGTCLRLEHIGPAEVRANDFDPIVNLLADVAQADDRRDARDVQESAPRRTRMGRIALRTPSPAAACIGRCRHVSEISRLSRREEIRA